MRRLICILLFPLFFSCVSNKNSDSESFQSKVLKKSLHFLNFKQSILDNLEKNRQFVNKEDEQRTPPNYILKKYEVETHNILGRAVYILNPPNKESKPTIFFLHGGAYMANTLPIHWKFLDNIINKTDVTVILPDYPLAPDKNWSDAYEFMDLLQSQLLNHREDIIYMGDSAGAGLALSWSMMLRDRFQELPAKLILLSPWVDISMTNNSIPKIENEDPYLSQNALTVAGRYWTDGLDVNDWRVSPLYGELQDLPNIYIFTGTSDILNPDARLLYSKVLENSGNIELYEYKNMIHDWMFFSMPESEKCINQITTLIKSEN